MVDPKDEEWLKKVLRDCFNDKSDITKDEKTLEGFRTLVSNLVKNIEKRFTEVRILWEKEPQSSKIREKFDYLAKHLFYLRRFCQPQKNKRKKKDA